ncbi:serine hydrolase domain-containing protein [Lysinibacillus sp. RC46]|uniref:serine hydrolase domain-containing protein n=1 Tax=Lysinibacillus sp. RC46 TaxID=3156295 RepID=UPI0035195DC8
MKKISVYKTIVVCLLFIPFYLFQPVSQISADSGEQDIKRTINKYVENFLEEQRIPGASIAIVHKNDIFHSKSWGVTGESEEKVTAETPFVVGSISKSLTGLAIMRLVDAGIIQLDDPVQKYMPWFTLKDKQASSQITIKQLLTQTSGISTYSGLAISDKESKDLSAIKENAESLSNVKLTAAPGEKHQYSNANFSILGALIEEVTNLPFSEYMEEQVFSPLGMKSAAANSSMAYEKGYLSGYQSWLGHPVKSTVTFDNGGTPYGYITASATDMVQYIKLLSHHEHNDFLSKNALNLYISPFVQTSKYRYYGLGVRISYPESKEEMIWHSGSNPDARSEVFYLPETDWGGVILTNKSHILEEKSLLYLKEGIINILNGKEPVDTPKYKPTFQVITIAILCLLFVMFIYLLLKVKTNKGRVSGIFGFILLVLAIISIPLLSYNTGTPWHTIRYFAPDIAFLAIALVTLLTLNGLLSIYIAFKRRQKRQLL